MKGDIMAQTQRYDLTRVVFMVVFIGGLIAFSLWIVRPFVAPTIWAVMIVVSTWQLMLAVERLARGRRWVAVTVMSFSLCLLLIVPLSVAIGTLVANLDDIGEWGKRLREVQVPPPPSWLPDAPLVGARATELWQRVHAQGLEAVREAIAPYARDLVSWFVAEMGSFGKLFIQCLLTVVAAAILYAYGEGAAAWMRRFGARLGGERGEAAIRLAGQAIRSVARGVIVTALVQTAVGGIGLFIAGVPFASVLTALMFLLAVAQIGAGPLLIVPVIWLYWSGSPGMGTFLLIVTVIAVTLDNVLRPLLIKQGAADLPLLLIFLGVIGGLVSFGLIGIFIGPLVLAVTHTLLNAWLQAERQHEAPAEGQVIVKKGIGPKSNTAA
jgi:predicted PurR-regulated permease PerM